MASTFEMVIAVESPEIDVLGHVSNIVYLRWVQDIARAHWITAASAEQQAELVWMVVRHEIDFKHPAILGDEIIVRTWVGKAEGLRFERFTEMLRRADRTLLAQARTLWCPIDSRTKRPRRASTDILQRFSINHEK